ncbi:glycosyltransferase [Propionivibrio sp.]|uniref:glycosyltransferase n=1 Tax=Propionivibrio sp. TaxID=2212460 RepID=UPI003BF07E92
MQTDQTHTLLVIAGEFPPLKTIGRIRTVKFVEHLRAHGWKAIVVTLEPSGGEPNYDSSLLAEIGEGVEVIRLPLEDIEARIALTAKRLLGRGGSPALPRSQPATAKAPLPALEKKHASTSLIDRAHAAVRWVLKHFVFIPDSYVPWARLATKECLRICAERKIDAIYTTLPPFSSAYIGHDLRRATGLPWIADYRDLWYGDVLREWLPEWRKRYELRIEKRLLREADVIVTVSEPKTAYMQRLHPNLKARWETLTNGYDDDIYGGRQRTRPVGRGPIEFVYTGRLFKNRRGYAFAEALGRLHQTDPEKAENVRVRILGGVEPGIRAIYDEILARYTIAHLYDFAGDVSYHAAMDAQINCDYLLLIVDTGETSDGVIPGKLFEYVAARRPIFALCDPGATQQIIERAGLGKAVPAESVQACEAMLREWLSSPVPEEVKADTDFLARFDRREITRRLAMLLNDVVATRTASLGQQ